jgi:glycosyltransferase involved in cell wall biosynthesis
MTAPLRILVWQWGRRGAGPRFAVELASGLNRVNDIHADLSLSRQSEQMQSPSPPPCALPVPTYASLHAYLWRMATIPFRLPGLVRQLRALAPDVAICAMPAPLDLLMAGALRRLNVPYFVTVHDADPHPGDGFPFQMALQRRLARGARGLITLSGHVAARLREQGVVGDRALIASSHPPFVFGPPSPPPGAHGGRLRVLFFGRLLPYKGLDLFAEALRSLNRPQEVEVRVAGNGPESAALAELRGLPGVTVDNRWIPEDEIADLLAWADVLVLSHKEASQSGVAAAAIAARRWVVATRVGGLAEQLRDEKLARLCEPTAAGVATALAGLLRDPPSGTPAESAITSWQATAAALARDIAVVLQG